MKRDKPHRWLPADELPWRRQEAGERVVSSVAGHAAVLHIPSGRVASGYHHADAYIKLGLDPDADHEGECVSGWLTNMGNFCDGLGNVLPVENLEGFGLRVNLR